MLLVVPSTADAAADFAKLNQVLADEVAMPVYAAYTDAAAKLPPAIAAVCTGEAAGSDDALAAFGSMVLAWQRAQPIALGPAMDGHGRARVHWWPDERGTGDRQLRRLLFEADEAALKPERLDQASVAVKGLSALEALLFEHDLEAEPFACRYTLAVAEWQAALASAISDGWPAFRADMVAADAGESSVYYDAEDAAQAWLQSLLESLDLLVLDKLERPLGSSVEEARGRFAELNEASLALPSLAANLETIRAFIAVPGGFADAMAAVGSGPLGAGLADVADLGIAQAMAIDMPLEEAVTDPAGREQVVELLDTVKRLRLLAGGPLARDLGLVTGFNAADGD